MKKISKPVLLISSIIGAAAIVFVVFWRIDNPAQSVIPRSKVAARTPIPQAAEREKLDELAVTKPAQAEKGYRTFIAKNMGSKSKSVQEEVANARYRVGFLAARRKDFEGARSMFHEASAKYAGTGKVSSDFGGIKDGSDYQAAVCLVAEGKKDEARAAFSQFLKSEPLSPLAKAAYRRLVRLDDGKSNPTYETLLQQDLKAQQKYDLFEMSTCGPRALDYLLPLVGKQTPGYTALSKICGTTEKGTSIEGMRKALLSFGIKTFGYTLNRDDFQGVAAPAIILREGHFVVLTKIQPTWIEIYDPLYREGRLETMELPAKADAAFNVTVLALKPVTLSSDSAEQPDQAEAPPPGLAAVKANREDAEKKKKVRDEQIAAAKKESAAETPATKSKPDPKRQDKPLDLPQMLTLNH